MIDYEVYVLSTKEKLLFYVAAAVLSALLGHLFYKSVIAAAAIFAAGTCFRKRYSEYLKKRRKKKLMEEFRDFLYSVSASAAAGHQLPSAIKNAEEEISAAFGADNDMSTELRFMSTQYEMSHTEPEILIADLARRSGCSEISQFADSCLVCRNSGGDLEHVAIKSASVLLEKLDFQDELHSLVSQKRLDIAVLTAMPLMILLFLDLTSDSYLRVLYTSLAGRILMTASLAMMAAALVVGLKIIEIDV